MSRDVGANVVRLDVGWSSLETDGKGRMSDWYVQKLDQFVNGADARGIKVIVTLWGTPCWASSAPDSIKQSCAGSWWDRGVLQYPPTNAADYGDISRWVTARYGTKLAALEVWNEPNLEEDRFWKSDDEAGDYVKLLRAAYPAAKAGNASVPVLAGSLAAADKPFLDRMYAAGAKGYYDGISIHPYNEWRDPADMWKPEWRKYTLVPGTQWVHGGQVAAGDKTPIWITEFGWSGCTGMNWCVSEGQQADYTARSVDIIANRLPYVRAATVYDLRDEGTSKTRMDDNFGLVRHDYTPKPVYAALKCAWAGRPQPAQPATNTLSPPPRDGAKARPLAATVSLPTTDGAKAPLPSRKPRKPRKHPRITVRRRHGTLLVRGRATPGTVLELRLIRCGRHHSTVRARATSRRLVVGASGRFRARLGRLRRKERGRVIVRVVRQAALTAARTS